MFKLLTLTTALFGFSTAKIYFADNFETDPFTTNRWVQSGWKQDSGEAGKLESSGGLWGAGDSRGGIRTTEDAKFYSFSAKMSEEFDNTGKDLVFGFSVKHEQKMDCGGGYAKLLPPGIDQSTFNGDTEYSIMFGPDICGYSTKKVQAIFRDANGDNLLRNNDVKCPDDEYTHTYLLVVKPDDTYQIQVDGEESAAGNLKDDWSFEKPQRIKDPEQSKPEDWVDDEEMDDPSDEKPSDWDDEPANVADPDAVKPDDWDDEEDGEWEAPMIDNPEYKGVFRAKRIPNPDYKGPWEHPEIDNPEYVEAKDVYKRGKVGYVGIEVWQVKAGTVFSDFIVSDNVDEAVKFFEDNAQNADDEKSAKEAYDEANKPPEPEEDEGDEETEDDHDEL